MPVDLHLEPDRGEPTRHAMSLSGSTRTMNLVELLQWASAAKKTGRFDFRNGAIIREVYLDDGVIVFASSNQATELLGHHLIARGKLTEEQLRATMLARQPSDAFIGQVLVRLGFVTHEELTKAIAERTEEIVYSLFEWDEAEFHFEPAELPSDEMVLISLSVNNVLLRGVHRHDEMRRIKEVFPDGRVILSPGDASPPAEIMKHPLARRIIASVDGQRTIDEIAFLLHANPFPVRKFLHEAFRLGLVEIDSLDGPPVMLITHDSPEAELTDMSGPSRMSAAHDRLKRGDPESALALLDQLSLSASPEARELERRAEDAFIDRVFREELKEDARPESTRPLDQLMGERLRPEEFFLLSRMDGRATVREIIDIAPAREIETVRVLRRLVRRGLVRIPTPSTV